MSSSNTQPATAPDRSAQQPQPTPAPRPADKPFTIKVSGGIPF